MAVGFCFYTIKVMGKKKACYREILGYIHGCKKKKKKKNIAVKRTKMPRGNFIYRKIIMWGMIGWRMYSPIRVPMVLDIIHSMEKLIHVIYEAMEERIEILLLQYSFLFFIFF